MDYGMPVVTFLLLCPSGMSRHRARAAPPSATDRIGATSALATIATAAMRSAQLQHRQSALISRMNRRVGQRRNVQARMSLLPRWTTATNSVPHDFPSAMSASAVDGRVRRGGSGRPLEPHEAWQLIPILAGRDEARDTIWRGDSCRPSLSIRASEEFRHQTVVRETHGDWHFLIRGGQVLNEFRPLGTGGALRLRGHCAEQSNRSDDRSNSQHEITPFAMHARVSCARRAEGVIQIKGGPM